MKILTVSLRRTSLDYVPDQLDARRQGFCATNRVWWRYDSAIRHINENILCVISEIVLNEI